LLYLKRLKASQQGFTLVELLFALMIFLMISAGIQMFLVSSLASIGRQGRVEVAEDLGEIVSSQVARDTNNFNTLNALLTGTRSSYLTSPVVVHVFPPLNAPLHPSSLMDMTSINAQAFKLGDQTTVDLDLLVSPLDEGGGNASLNQLIVTARVRWKQTAASNKYSERMFRRVLSRDFSTY
jgi:prepilin-type N-terminal cleavage/methylation domain-containing protein